MTSTRDDIGDDEAGAARFAARPDADLLRGTVEHLASFERGSATEGERRAAEWIAAALRDEGCEATVDEEPAHGTYWWPLGLMTAAAGLAALSGRRALMAAVGAVAVAGIRDDITGGRLWFRRRALPTRSCWNVVARTGDPDATRTIVIVAHHDAAHTSLLFHPGVAPAIFDRFPALLPLANDTPPLMYPVIGGPGIVALAGLTGSRRLRAAGAALALGTAATMAEIGARAVVPGANDNLSGVATLLGVARALREDPPRGVRVLLVSTGSEESFMEGMQAFVARHGSSLPTDSTAFVCVDTVGSPRLTLLEGEGMLAMNDYDEGIKEYVQRCADARGVELVRGLRFRNATDGLVSHKAGYPTAVLGSVTRYKVPANYHWPTDTADRVAYSTVGDCVDLCTEVARRAAGEPAPAAAQRSG